VASPSWRSQLFDVDLQERPALLRITEAEMESTAGPIAVIERLAEAINRHDLEAIMACFADDVDAAQPIHPERNFVGADQMRANWAITLENLIDLRAEVMRCSADGDTVWLEWCWRARRPDGSPFVRAGVAIHGIKDDRISWVRLYMELIVGDATNGAGPGGVTRYRLG
jgi:ketosteroid isomerase-like protein